MGKTIIYNDENGEVALVFCMENHIAKFPTEEDGLANIIENDIPAGVKYVVIDSNDVPVSREFRSAWVIEGDRIVVDMPKARDIHMERIRMSRDAPLAALDIKFMRAVEMRDDAKTAEIAAQKAVLRDLPNKIDLTKFSTPEELDAYWPKELPSREG